MNPLSASALFLRRRTVWEAADFGILLWRKNFICLIPFFVLPVVIAAIGIRSISSNSIYLSIFLLWWIKPIFDRLVLHVVSVRFFTEGGKSSLFRGLPAMRRGLLGDLLWRRFSPGRAARMPIRVLEHASGGQFRARKKALAAGGLNFCSIITLFGLSLEAMLLLGEVVFVVAITQTLLPSGMDLFQNNPGLAENLIFAAFCLNYILTGSLYVCMGFSLYINSRVEVEGWDLQLLFQRFAASSAAPRPAATAILMLCIFLALPRPASADPNSFMEALPSPGTESLETLENILASPDFGEYRDGWGIFFRERERGRVRPERPGMNLSWMERAWQVFAYILRTITILTIAVSVCFVVYWYWKNKWRFLPRFRRDRGKSYITPLFSPESPELLFSRAEDFFNRGNLREAWAACLAGSIAACTKYHSLSFPPNATEYGCLELLRRKLPAEAASFGALVQNWIFFAYGGRPPGDGAFEEALAYCRSLIFNHEGAQAAEEGGQT